MLFRKDWGGDGVCLHQTDGGIASFLEQLLRFEEETMLKTYK